MTLLSRIADVLTGAKPSKEDRASLLSETAYAIKVADDTVAQRETEIVEAKAKVDALMMRLDAEAAGALEGGEAARKYNATASELDAVKNRLGILERAHRTAVKDAADLRVAQSQLARAELIKTISRLTEQRAAAAEGLATAVADAVKFWCELCASTDRIRMAYPGGVLAGGTLPGYGSLERVLTTELYRISGNPFRGAGVSRGIPAFPGSKVPDIRLAPSTLPTLVDEVVKANARLVAALNAQTTLKPAPADAVKDEPAKVVESAPAAFEELIGEAPAEKPKAKTRTAQEIQNEIRPKKLAV